MGDWRNSYSLPPRAELVTTGVCFVRTLSEGRVVGNPCRSVSSLVIAHCTHTKDGINHPCAHARGDKRSSDQRFEVFFCGEYSQAPVVGTLYMNWNAAP